MTFRFDISKYEPTCNIMANTPIKLIPKKYLTLISAYRFTLEQIMFRLIRLDIGDEIIVIRKDSGFILPYDFKVICKK